MHRARERKFPGQDPFLSQVNPKVHGPVETAPECAASRLQSADMRRVAPMLVVLTLAVAGFAADVPPAGVPLLPCGEGAAGSLNCNPSKSDLKRAKAAYREPGRRQAACLKRRSVLSQTTISSVSNDGTACLKRRSVRGVRLSQTTIHL